VEEAPYLLEGLRAATVKFHQFLGYAPVGTGPFIVDLVPVSGFIALRPRRLLPGFLIRRRAVLGRGRRFGGLLNRPRNGRRATVGFPGIRPALCEEVGVGADDIKLEFPTGDGVFQQGLEATPHLPGVGVASLEQGNLRMPEQDAGEGAGGDLETPIDDQIPQLEQGLQRILFYEDNGRRGVSSGPRQIAREIGPDGGTRTTVLWTGRVDEYSHRYTQIKVVWRRAIAARLRAIPYVYSYQPAYCDNI
jgi:hypothetical protein